MSRIRLDLSRKTLLLAVIESALMAIVMAWVPRRVMSAVEAILPQLSSNLNLGLLTLLGLLTAFLAIPSRILTGTQEEAARIAKSAAATAYLLAAIWTPGGFGVLRLGLGDAEILVNLGLYAWWLLALALANLGVGAISLCVSARREGVAGQSS